MNEFCSGSQEIQSIYECLMQVIDWWELTRMQANAEQFNRTHVMWIWHFIWARWCSVQCKAVNCSHAFIMRLTKFTQNSNALMMPHIHFLTQWKTTSNKRKNTLILNTFGNFPNAHLCLHSRERQMFLFTTWFVVLNIVANHGIAVDFLHIFDRHIVTKAVQTWCK